MHNPIKHWLDHVSCRIDDWFDTKIEEMRQCSQAIRNMRELKEPEVEFTDAQYLKQEILVAVNGKVVTWKKLGSTQQEVEALVALAFQRELKLFHEENWTKDNLESLLAECTENEAQKWIDFFDVAVVVQLFRRSEVEVQLETVRTFLRIKEIQRRRARAIEKAKDIITAQNDSDLFSLNTLKPFVDTIVKLGLATKASLIQESDEGRIMRDVIPRQMASWAKDCISLLCAGVVPDDLIKVQADLVYQVAEDWKVPLAELCKGSGFSEEEFLRDFSEK